MDNEKSNRRYSDWPPFISEHSLGHHIWTVGGHRHPQSDQRRHVSSRSPSDFPFTGIQIFSESRCDAESKRNQLLEN